jgi:hypothetical protein
MQKVGNVIKEFLVPEIRVKESYLLLKMYSCKNNFGERYKLIIMLKYFGRVK